MGRGTRLGLRATITLVIVLSVGAVGILMPTLSNTVERDTQVNGFAVTLTVEGVPATVSPGDIFRVVATFANNANRPVPTVLRMEIRNPNGTTPGEITVYAGCGAEEVVSSRTLRYYIGWNGPLLAPNGISFPTGTTVATIVASIGGADYWLPTLHEIQERDLAGYESLIEPGLNASEGVRASGSDVLKVLNYYGMVHGVSESSANLADWILEMPFAERLVASGDGSQDGYLVEVHPQTRGSLEFKFWAERPDGLGVLHHPFSCGPL